MVNIIILLLSVVKLDLKNKQPICFYTRSSWSTTFSTLGVTKHLEMFSGAETSELGFLPIFVQQGQKEDIYENCLEIENRRRSQIQVQPYKYRVQ